MKKVLLLSLGLVMGLSAFAQQQVTVAKSAVPAPVKAAFEKKALGTEVVEGTANFEVRGTQSVVVNEGVDYMDAEAMYTTYDLQSNKFLSNRMYQAKDGSVAVTATMSRSEFDASFVDRGTGYNFATRGKVGKWGGISGVRVEAKATGEDIRTGWPTIAPYGAEGEILVNHGHKEGLAYYIREKAGQGEWDGPHAIPTPEGVDEVVKGTGNTLSWARIATTGENNDVLHVFAAASGDSNVAQYYLRTADLKDWTIGFSPLEKDDLHINVYSADSYGVSANGDNIAVVYCGGFSAHVMLYESNDAGLTWESRMVWESPVDEDAWFDEENEDFLYEGLYGPTHASVAIGKDGVSHVVLSTGLYDLKPGGYYSLYYGLLTDGVAYWNDTTCWEYTVEGTDTIAVPSPIRSTQDDDLRNALRLWWPSQEDTTMMSINFTNFCAITPPHPEDGFNAFDATMQYTGSEGTTAGDYLMSFGCCAYPSIAVDPAGNLAVAYSAPQVDRTWQNAFYMRSLFVNYKPVDSLYWWQMPVLAPTNLYEDFIHSGDECTFVTAVSTPVNENEFWFSCLSDETPGFYSGANNPSQANITTSIVNVFKFNPVDGLTDEGEEIGVNETIDVVYNVFPNPASEYICVSSSMDANATVTFTNIAGQTVKVVNTNLTTGDNTIVVSDLTSGVYFCTVTANGYSHTSKVVVK